MCAKKNAATSKAMLFLYNVWKRWGFAHLVSFNNNTILAPNKVFHCEREIPFVRKASTTSC